MYGIDRTNPAKILAILTYSTLSTIYLHHWEVFSGRKGPPVGQESQIHVLVLSFKNRCTLQNVYGNNGTIPAPILGILTYLTLSTVYLHNL